MTGPNVELPYTSFVWQPRSSGFVCTAVAKATLVLEPGEATLAAEHEPISESDGHWDDNPVRSLFIPADVVPLKSRIDVIAVGHAFAGPQARVRQLVARLSLGTIDKSIEVHCDRSLSPDGAVFEGSPFARIPLVYERTRGGTGTWNPVGIPRDDRDRHGNLRLPNLQQVGATPTGRLDPVGFGPIAPTWPQRADRVRYPGSFVTTEWTKRPLSDGFDLAFFNVAPTDQQLETLPANPTLVLENLHPEHPKLATRLPTLTPIAIFEGRGKGQEVPMHLDTIWIDCDRGLCTLTYRAQMPMERADDVPRVRVGLSKGPPGLERRRSLTPTGMFSGGETASGLPFGQQPGAPASRETAAPPANNETTQLGPALVQDLKPSWMDQASTQPRQTIADGGVPWTAGSVTPFAPTFGGSPPTPQPVKRSQAVTIAHPQMTPGRPPPAQPVLDSGPTTAVVTNSPVPTQQVAPPPVAPPAMIAAPAMAPMMSTPTPSPAFSTPSPFIGSASSNASSGPSYAAPAFTSAGNGFSPAPVQNNGNAPTESPWQARGSNNVGGPVAPGHVSNAALLGVTGASNAAADERPGAPGEQVRRGRPTAMDLLWFDPEVLPRVRRKKAWQDLIDELEQRPWDPELDSPAPGEAAADVEDRREILQVIARAIPSGEGAIDAALDGAVRADGRFATPLLIVAGDLSLEFDELETLKAIVSIATPLTAGDEDLKASVDQANGYLAVPGLVVSPDVAGSLTTRIREAFAKGKRSVPATYLDTESERALLEKRAYQKRDVFGAKHLRGLLFFAGSTSGVPTYLPEALAKKLPLFRRIPVRLLVDVVFQADQFETHPTALLAAAITRVVRGTN